MFKGNLKNENEKWKKSSQQFKKELEKESELSRDQLLEDIKQQLSKIPLIKKQLEEETNEEKRKELQLELDKLVEIYNDAVRLVDEQGEMIDSIENNVAVIRNNYLSKFGSQRI